MEPGGAWGARRRAGLGWGRALVLPLRGAAGWGRPGTAPPRPPAGSGARAAPPRSRGAASNGGPGPRRRHRPRSVGPGGAPEVTMGRVRRGHALPGERRAGRSWAAGTGPPGCPGGLGAALPCPAGLHVASECCSQPSVCPPAPSPSPRAAGQVTSGAHSNRGHPHVAEGLLPSQAAELLPGRRARPGLVAAGCCCSCIWCLTTDTKSGKHGIGILSVQCNVKYKAIFGCVHVVGFLCILRSSSLNQD